MTIWYFRMRNYNIHIMLTAVTKREIQRGIVIYFIITVMNLIFSIWFSYKHLSRALIINIGFQPFFSVSSITSFIGIYFNDYYLLLLFVITIIVSTILHLSLLIMLVIFVTSPNLKAENVLNLDVMYEVCLMILFGLNIICCCYCSVLMIRYWKAGILERFENKTQSYPYRRYGK